MKINISFLLFCWAIGIDYDRESKNLFIYPFPTLVIMIRFQYKQMYAYQIDDYIGDWYFVCAYNEENAIECFENETGELFDIECKITLMDPKIMARVYVRDDMNDGDDVLLSEMMDRLRQPCILASSVE
jgi:hypothetical protein